MLWYCIQVPFRPSKGDLGGGLVLFTTAAELATLTASPAARLSIACWAGAI
jgi:hypothetical protein